MKERPILFSGPMVRALLDGRKTQTRRLVKPRGLAGEMRVRTAKFLSGALGWEFGHDRTVLGVNATIMRCPYGGPGDMLWVRETWSADFDWPGDDGEEVLPWHKMPAAFRGPKNCASVYYAADRLETDAPVTLEDGTLAVHPKSDQPPAEEWEEVRWHPSIHMPRWVSRIMLKVKSIRVERVQDISGADAIAEGFAGQSEVHGATARDRFLSTFYDLNERAPRTENPWVWVIEFRRLEGKA